VAALIAALAAALFTLTAFATPDRLQARASYWHSAWQSALHHPVGGFGAGTFDLSWAAYGDLGRWGGAVDAHNLYLESLSELGLVGLVLVLALLVPLVSALRVNRPAATTAAALAGAATYLVHAGLDWDWEMPAVTTAGFACLAATLPARTSPRPSVRWIRITLFAVETATILGYLVYLALHSH
jgi:O-antigen ligase